MRVDLRKLVAFSAALVVHATAMAALRIPRLVRSDAPAPPTQLAEIDLTVDPVPSRRDDGRTPVPATPSGGASDVAQAGAGVARSRRKRAQPRWAAGFPSRATRRSRSRSTPKVTSRAWTHATRSAMRDLAASVHAAMRARTVRVPPGARGVIVALRVESKMRTASAHAAGPATIRILGIPVRKGKPGSVAVDVTPFMISGNIDPTDAILDATSPDVRSVQVWTVGEHAL
jgi:hypothetical protein